MITSLMLLAACGLPAPKETPVVLPVVVVKDAPEKAEDKKTAEKPKAETRKETKPEQKTEKIKADSLCPPKEGETDQQRIVRKLDCLIERN